MNKQTKLWTICSITLLLSIVFTTTAWASTFQLSGRVTDQSGNPLADTSVEIIDPGSGSTISSAITDGTGSYAITVEEGTYNIGVTPPAGSGLGAAIVLNRTIDADSEIDFVLVPVGSTTLSGRFVDPLGNPIPNERIGLSPLGTSNYDYQYTGANGEYSFEVAPGDHIFQLVKQGNPGSNTPSYYNLQLRYDTPIHLEVDTVLDIVLPTKQVRVRVQDPGGNPVANVGIHTNWPTNSWLPMGSYYLQGGSGYHTHVPPAVTDANGDVTLWLFPTSSGNTYTFTATPLLDSPFVTFTIFDIVLTEDKEIVIVLQFTHDPPVTAIALDAEQNEAGDYYDPRSRSVSRQQQRKATA